MPGLDHAALQDAAEQVRRVSLALAARTRVAEFRFEFSPSTVQEIEDSRYRALPAAAARSFLGDCLYRQERDLFLRWFEPVGDAASSFALAGPVLPWPVGSEIPGGGRAVSIRVLTWDPGGELLPALLMSGITAVTQVGDGRVESLVCPAIGRLDPESWFPASSADSSIGRFHLETPLQLRRRDSRSGRRPQLDASAMSPGLIARAAWLRLAELSRHSSQSSDGLELDSRFVEEDVFTEFAAALDTAAPEGKFRDAFSRWRSKRQGGKKIDLSGVTGIWPAKSAWTAEEASGTLGESGAVLWSALLRIAALYQIGRRTVYGCGLLVPIATHAFGEGYAPDESAGRGVGQPPRRTSACLP